MGKIRTRILGLSDIEKQQKEDEEWWSELDQAYEEQIKSEKLESKPIKKPE